MGGVRLLLVNTPPVAAIAKRLTSRGDFGNAGNSVLHLFTGPASAAILSGSLQPSAGRRHDHDGFRS
jgi:hypothetical protein